MRRVVLSVTLLVALALPATGAASSYSQLIVFGDDLSDNGNLFAAKGYPPFPYAQRFSNGPVAVEYLAASLGIPLLDLAYGGATTGPANLLNTTAPELGGNLPGMAQELSTYVASLGGGPADPNALYLVMGGHNDVFNARALNQDPVAALATAAGNMTGIVNALFALGAQYVVVPGMLDLGLMPAFAANPAGGTALTNFYNGLLMGAFANSPVIYFDTAEWMRTVVANPAAFGFTNVTEPCFTSSPLFLCGSTVAQQNLYLFWDGVHPTTAAHQLLANDLRQAIPDPAVPEPAILILVAAGLAGAVWRRALR